MRRSLRSHTVTLMSGHFWAMTDMVGPPTYPAPRQQILGGIGYSSTELELDIVGKEKEASVGGFARVVSGGDGGPWMRVRFFVASG